MFKWFWNRKTRPKRVKAEPLFSDWRSREDIRVDMASGRDRSHTTFMVNGKVLKPGTPEYDRAWAEFQHDMREFRRDMEKMKEDLRSMFK